MSRTSKEAIVMDEPDGDLPQAHDIHDLILIKGKEYQEGEEAGLKQRAVGAHIKGLNYLR